MSDGATLIVARMGTSGDGVGVGGGCGRVGGTDKHLDRLSQRLVRLSLMSAPASSWSDLCPHSPRVQDERSIDHAAYVPFEDLISSPGDPIAKDDAVVLGDRHCYSQEAMRAWARSFLTRSAVMRAPNTQRALGIGDLQMLYDADDETLWQLSVGRTQWCERPCSYGLSSSPHHGRHERQCVVINLPRVQAHAWPHDYALAYFGGYVGNPHGGLEQAAEDTIALHVPSFLVHPLVGDYNTAAVCGPFYRETRGPVAVDHGLSEERFWRERVPEHCTYAIVGLLPEGGGPLFSQGVCIAVRPSLKRSLRTRADDFLHWNGDMDMD